MQLRAWMGLASLALAPAVALASEPLELPLIVETGQRMQVNYVHTKRQNDEIRSVDVRGQLHIIDADSDPANMLVEWQTDSVRADGFEIDARSPQAADLMIGLPITYVASEALEPLRIFDRDDLMRRIFNAEFLVGVDNASRDKMRDFFANMDDTSFAQILLKVPGYIAICHDTALIPGEPSEFDISFPSPVPGVTIKGTGRYLVEVDSVGAVTVQMSSTYDPESIKEMALVMMKQAGVEDAPSEEEIAQFRIERTDITNCDVDRDTGWVQRMTFASEIITPAGEQGERYDVDIFRIN
ncbi:MAG: hypothetical protein AAFS02_12095 [Pseudomonadota bacterium]